jgi:hypothetical protein
MFGRTLSSIIIEGQHRRPHSAQNAAFFFCAQASIALERDAMPKSASLRRKRSTNQETDEKATRIRVLSRLLVAETRFC